MSNSLKKFVINNKTIEDFDALMEKHLDFVEELTVSGINNNSKILNIISLCINVKTIIIEGGKSVNVNNIIMNICKPQLLENLILDSVKLPNQIAMKKLTRLKMVSINNMEYCNIKEFLSYIICPEKIEAITFENVNFMQTSLNIIESFKNLKILNLLNSQNCELTDLEFLVNNKKLTKVNIENSSIDFKNVFTLLNGKYKKSINLKLPTTNKFSVISNSISINDNNKISVTLNISDLKEFEEKVGVKKIDNLLLIIDKKIDYKEQNKIFKKLNCNTQIAIKDASFLTVNDAEYLKRLGVKNVNILDFDGVFHSDANRNSYDINRYIKIRETIDCYINKISSHSTELEKFLQLYKILIEDISYDELINENIIEYNNSNESKSSNLENGLIDKQCVNSGFVEILKNCLACANIESNIISGTYGKSNKEIIWNQVKIDDNWYNVDIVLDSKYLNVKNVLAKKAPYCLLSNKDFYQTHKRKNGNAKNCIYTVNRKSINGFFRTGVFSENQTKVYLHIAIDKIKRMMRFKRVKSLPSPENHKDE